jgi:hypothetical protein
MKINSLALKDRNIFKEFFKLSFHELSVYSFENIYIWKDLFDIRWKIIEDNLCIFFQDRLSCFLYCSPLGDSLRVGVIDETFQIMDQTNRSRENSRIENIEEKDLVFYKDLNYEYTPKFNDYLYKTTDLVQLKGNKFKAKRACINYFMKNYEFEYLPFSSRYHQECLELYDYWSRERKKRTSDYIYQGMLKDSRTCLRIIIDNYKDLNFTGRIVKIDGCLKAFTFGFPLQKDIFCILFEITDLAIKGLSQFIFRQFSSEVKKYKYINIMDDSGLKNLERVKLSYRPIKLVKSYIIKRKK